MDTTTFLAALTLIAGFYMAWSIGANDVANAMGTSVGSKALTLRKAVLLAAVLEFSGAFLVGSNVSETIQRGIIHPMIFQQDPMQFVLGMLGALIATAVLLQVASYFGLPVSTTHAIVGAVLGFGLVVGGPSAVHWDGVAEIAASWVVSPVLSGLVSYGIFSLIQRKILYAQDPLEATKRLTPLFVFLCSAMVCGSLFYGESRFSATFALAGTLAICAPASLGAQWLVRRRVFAPVLAANSSSFSPSFGVEKIFVYLQILSACLVAFAHGANDVANAIGPVSAIFHVLQHQSLATHALVPSWLLALGGFGIVIGLATWGWRVIETIGAKITELTPTRGFSAEFGAAATILVASKLGLPISTTHALVGAVFGVGMARGLKALNLQTLKEIVLSWLVTIPLCAAFSVAAYALLRLFF